SIQSWPELAAIMRRILDDVMGRVRTLGTQIREKRISYSSQTQGDLQKMMLLHALNEAAGELTCLTQAPGVHPLTAFTALCQIVGRLSIFGAELIPPEFPPYDHDDLAPLFIWTRKRIRQYIMS